MFRLLSFAEGSVAVAGVAIGNRVHRAAGLLAGYGIEGSSILSLLEDWANVEPALAEAVDRARQDDGVPLEQVRLLAPVLYPNAIYCAAANYRDHMRAMAVKLKQAEEPDPRSLDINPFHFVLPGRSCTSGPEEPIVMPSHGELIDWEIELCAVIGRPARNVDVASALDHVAAYTIGNDVSVRDRRYLKIPNTPPESLFRVDFVGAKGFDKSSVFGPWLVPSRFVPDPQALTLTTWLDGEVMQDSSTAEMVFSTAEQIAYLSRRVTLLPGDIVMTGTPAGTGMERDRFLKDGETLRMRIEGIGEMTQRVVATAPA